MHHVPNFSFDKSMFYLLVSCFTDRIAVGLRRSKPDMW